MLINKYRFILGKLMATKLSALVTFWPQLSQWKTISMHKNRWRIGHQYIDKLKQKYYQYLR